MLDLVVYLAPENRGWVIERICSEIVRCAPGRARIVTEGAGPAARAHLYSHFALLPRHPLDARSRSAVLFYHPWSQERGLDPAKYEANETRYVDVLNQLDRVIVLASRNLAYLNSIGVHPERLAHAIVGSDPDLFPEHDRTGDGAIGFVSAFYPRKNPDRIFELVHRMPHRSFLLLGRGWEKYERFSDLVSAPNLRYVETDYGRYPQYYAQMDVFCSPSLLEGACVPILESMMCNVVPVVSDTGHAADLVRPAENGFLFDPRAPASEIEPLLERAFALRTNVRATVRHLTWERFARSVWRELELG